MPLRLLRQAEAQIRVARGRRQTAATRVRFNDELEVCLRAVQKKPGSSPKHPEAEDPAIRVAQLRTMPFLVLFHIAANDVRVLGVVHARSGPDTLASVFGRA